MKLSEINPEDIRGRIVKYETDFITDYGIIKSLTPSKEAAFVRYHVSFNKKKGEMRILYEDTGQSTSLEDIEFVGSSFKSSKEIDL